MQTIELNVKGMTCQGCVKSVERIIKKSDPDAVITIDLGTGHVSTQTSASLDVLTSTITAAGFEAKAA